MTLSAQAEISEIIVPLVRLHTLHLETRNIKPSHLMLEPQDVQTIMRNGTTSLRHLSINGLHWEVSHRCSICAPTMLNTPIG